MQEGTILNVSISAYVGDDETRRVVDEALRDRRFARSSVDVQPGGMTAAIEFHARNISPDVLLVDSDGQNSEMIGNVEELAEVCSEETQVILIGVNNDIRLFRDLMERGVSDYLVAPLTRQEIVDAVSDVCDEPPEARLGRVIAFIGAKGGAGSSTVACNTAWCLTKAFDEDVALLDLDITFGTVGLAFNLTSPQGIQDALADPDRLDEVLLDRFMSSNEDHLAILASPASLESDLEIDIDAFDVLLNLLRRKARFVVLDLPHIWTSWTQHILFDSHQVVITTQLDLASLRHTKDMVDAVRANSNREAPVRAVLNHAGTAKRIELSVKDFQDAIGDQPALVLAHEPAIFGAAANSGQMIGETNAKSKAADGFRRLAIAVSGREPPERRKGISAWIRRG